jgi:hypothetical protein
MTEDNDDLSLVEDSFYDHDRYGRVRLVSLRREAGEVLLERQESSTYVTGVGDIPPGVRESIGEFIDNAQPADLSLTPPTVEISADTNDIR